jgi:histidine decarboxylase
VLLLWYAIRRHGISGLRRRAEQSRSMAAYALRRLSKAGWPAYRNPHAFTVVLRTPPPAVTARWVLASSDGWSHIVCMPGVTRDQIDEFVEDLHAATTLTRRTLEERRRSARRRASAPARPGERESA